MKKTKKGFTIVELVIVIAVIAILAAVLIPNLSRLVEKANDSKALQEAESAMKLDLIEANGDYDNMGTEKEVYTLLTSKPSDWDSKYASYFTENAGTYTAVSGEPAPTYEANKYYSKVTYEGKITKGTDGKTETYVYEKDGYTCTFTIADGTWKVVKG